MMVPTPDASKRSHRLPPPYLARLSGAALLSAVVGCSPSQPKDDTAVDVPPQVSASETPISSQTPDLSGTWASASCGKRAYERIITVGADATFVADDRISPCPPGASCVWSGIVHRKGTWKRVALTLALFPDDVIDGKQAGEPFPSTLAPAAGGIEDDYGCAYVKR
jgi:hypothetical protein